MTAPIPLWVDRYRGKAFRFGADGPDAFDCYGLVRAILREQFGVHVPPLEKPELLDLAGRVALVEADPDCPWHPVGSEVPGDVLAFDEPRPDGTHGLHVGVVVAKGWMIHAHPDGVGVARYDRGAHALLRIGPAHRHRDISDAQVAG